MQAYVIRVFTGVPIPDTSESRAVACVYTSLKIPDEPREFIYAGSSNLENSSCTYTCTRTHIVHTESSRTANQLPPISRNNRITLFHARCTHRFFFFFNSSNGIPNVVSLREISRFLDRRLINTRSYQSEIYCIIRFFYSSLNLFLSIISDEICCVWVFFSYRELG